MGSQKQVNASVPIGEPSPGSQDTSFSKFCWSSNEEEFHGEFDSREEAIEEAFHTSDDYEHVWTGKVKPAIAFLRGLESFIGERVLEYLEETLCEEIPADDTIIEVTGSQAKDLGKAIVDWIGANADMNRYGVDNILAHARADYPEYALEPLPSDQKQEPNPTPANKESTSQKEVTGGSL